MRPSSAWWCQLAHRSWRTRVRIKDVVPIERAKFPSVSPGWARFIIEVRCERCRTDREETRLLKRPQ